jgi:DNA-binding transcriptional ArsR family regulator
MKSVRKKPVPLTSDQLAQAADCLRILAHPQRLAIVQLLLDESHTVGEIAEVCGMPQALTSGHLRLMQRCGLLKLERDGRHIRYSLAESCLADLMQCLTHRFSQTRS